MIPLKQLFCLALKEHHKEQRAYFCGSPKKADRHRHTWRFCLLNPPLRGASDVSVSRFLGGAHELLAGPGDGAVRARLLGLLECDAGAGHGEGHPSGRGGGWAGWAGGGSRSMKFGPFQRLQPLCMEVEGLQGEQQEHLKPPGC